MKTAFLNGTLQEEIYMKPPPGSKLQQKVLKLHKSLYGLKQAAQVWNKTLNNAMLKAGFFQSKFDECLYIMKQNTAECYAIVHVDDLLFASSSINLVQEIIRNLNK